MSAWRTLGVTLALLLDFTVCLLIFGTLFKAAVVFLLSVGVQYAYMTAMKTRNRTEKNAT